MHLFSRSWAVAACSLISPRSSLYRQWPIRPRPHPHALATRSGPFDSHRDSHSCPEDEHSVPSYLTPRRSQRRSPRLRLVPRGRQLLRVSRVQMWLMQPSVDHVTNVNDVTNTNVVTNTAHATRTRLANVTNTQSLTQTAFATSYRSVTVKQLLAKPTTKSAIARTAIGTAGLGISASALFGLARMRRRGDHLG